jgi:hypothetical protein
MKATRQPLPPLTMIFIHIYLIYFFNKQRPTLAVLVFNIQLIWRPAEAGGCGHWQRAARIEKITQSIYYD